MKVPAARIVFSPQDRSDILSMIDHSLQSGSLTLGPHMAAFERAFAERHHARHAIAVASGTAGIEIALRSLGVTGGEVIVPANTFFATAAAVVHAGGRPTFADVEASTMALSARTVEAVLTPKTVGVVMVHVAGLIAPDVVAVRDLCARRGIFLVEDAAHAHGSSYDSMSAGSFGEAAAFSFYPTKVLTSGEGGMLVTADEQLHDDALVYRDQGKAGFLGGEHIRLGYAWRMSELHAAVGLVHLRHLDTFILARQRVASVYDSSVHDIPGLTPLEVPDRCETNYYKYVVLLEHDLDRGDLKRRLGERGVSLAGEVYARPLHHEPIFSQYSIRGAQLPVAEDICRRHICLPIHSDMVDEEAEYVSDVLASAVATMRGLRAKSGVTG